MEEKKKHGGRRPGAGRPKGSGKLYSFRVSGDIAGYLDRQINKTKFIKDCIVEGIRKDGSLPESFGTVVPVSGAKSVVLPYFDLRVVAGFPIPLDNDERSQDIDVLSMLCPHPEASYLIRVIGDSMIDAGVYSGDIVIVDKSNRHPSSKEIAVCELNGEYTLKFFVEEDGCGWLVPANPDYPRIRVGPDDDFSIWGTVTYIIHRARG